MRNELSGYRGYDRVRDHTPGSVNRRIDLLTRDAITRAEEAGESAMRRRLHELDREWDIDRALMLVFSVVGGTTFGLGIGKNRNWLYLFSAQLGFIGLHAVAGRCPPVSVLRRIGFRTRQEIDAEKHALLLRLGGHARARRAG